MLVVAQSASCVQARSTGGKPASAEGVTDVDGATGGESLGAVAFAAVVFGAGSGALADGTALPGGGAPRALGWHAGRTKDATRNRPRNVGMPIWRTSLPPPR